MTQRTSPPAASPSHFLPLQLLRVKKVFILAACALSVGCSSDPFDSAQQSLRHASDRYGERPHCEDPPDCLGPDAGYEDASVDAPDGDGGECVGVTPSKEKTKLNSHEAEPGSDGEAEVDIQFNVPSLAESMASADLTLHNIGAARVFHQVFGDEVPFTFDPNGTIAERMNFYTLRDSAFSNWSLETDGLLVGGQSIQCETVREEATRTYLKTCGGSLWQAVKAVYVGEDVIVNDLGSNRYPENVSFTAGVLRYDLQASIRYDITGNVLGWPELDIRGSDFANTDITYSAELNVRNVPAGGCQWSLGLSHTEREDAESSTRFMVGVSLFSN